MRVKTWTLSGKFMFGLSCIAGAVLLMFGGLRLADAFSEQASEAHAQATSIGTRTQAVSSSVAEQAAAVRLLLLTRSDREVKAFADATAAVDAELALARTDAKDNPALGALVARLEKLTLTYRTVALDPVVKFAREKQWAKATDLAKSAPVIEQDRVLRAGFAAIRSEANAQTDAALAMEARADQIFFVVQVAGTVVVLLMTAMIGLWFSRGMAGGIRAMLDVMNRLAKGDLSVSIPTPAAKDEVGQIAAALTAFRQNALRNREMEAEAARVQAETAEAERRAQVEAIAAERTLVVNSIGKALERLAAKDLSYRMTDTLPEAYADLQRNMSAVTIALSEALAAVVSSGTTISNGTRELRAAADDLARRTEQQAANLEETSAAITQMTESVRQTAQGAAAARDVVVRSSEEASKIGAVVEQATAAMTDIQSSSREVTQIIGLIDEIAFQTNLLALNAGVEAARAGESGKGFAVVASEVRALAQRSAGAAKEIKSLLSKSSDQVDHGVDLVREVSASLGQVIQQVASLGRLTSDFAQAADQQSSTLSEINKAVADLDRMTQENASMVEQSTAATHSLGQEVGRMTSLVSAFRIDGVGATAMPVRLVA